MISPEYSLPAARLDPLKHQDTAWCVNCGGLQILLSIFEIESGRIALCLGCGDEKFLPFTRVTGVAA